jgi:hypothetical protein
MRKQMLLGTMIASMGMLLGMGGCAGAGLGPDVIRGLMEDQRDAQRRAIREGVPADELDKLMAEAVAWIGEKVPNDPDVMNAEYMKIFVVGGTLNTIAGKDNLQSVSDEEVAIRTRNLFHKLRNVPEMENNFLFFDRTSDFGVDITALTGDLSQYGDPLSRGNDAQPDQYQPRDIYLVKLAFEEIQKLGQAPASINFTLTATIEWGGRPGHIRHSNVFESKLKYKTNAIGYRGKWVSED